MEKIKITWEEFNNHFEITDLEFGIYPQNEEEAKELESYLAENTPELYDDFLDGKEIELPLVNGKLPTTKEMIEKFNKKKF